MTWTKKYFTNLRHLEQESSSNRNKDTCVIDWFTFISKFQDHWIQLCIFSCISNIQFITVDLTAYTNIWYQSINSYLKLFLEQSYNHSKRQVICLNKYLAYNFNEANWKLCHKWTNFTIGPRSIKCYTSFCRPNHWNYNILETGTPVECLGP